MISWKIPWRRDRLPTPVFLEFPLQILTQMVKNPPAIRETERDLGLIPGLGRSPGGGHGNPFQYSCLENPMDRGVRRAAVHGVAKSRT